MHEIDLTKVHEESKKFANIDLVPTNRQIKSNFKEFKFFQLNTFDDLKNFNDDTIRLEISKIKSNFESIVKDFLSDPKKSILVATSENSVVGICIYSLLAKNAQLSQKLDKLDPDKTANIEFLFVQKGSRGFLLGQKLLALAEYLSIEKGYSVGVIVIKNTDYFLLSTALAQSYTISSLDESNFVLTCPLGKIIEDIVEQYSVKNTDMKWQQDVLDLGFVGIKVINYKSNDKFFVSYSKDYYN